MNLPELLSKQFGVDLTPEMLGAFGHGCTCKKEGAERGGDECGVDGPATRSWDFSFAITFRKIIINCSLNAI